MEPTKSPLMERVEHRVRRWPRRVVITVVVVAALLFAARLAMPPVVRSQVNKRLQSIPGYVGQVDDIDIHLWRGAYSLGGVSIYKQTGEVREPFVLVRHIDFSIAWRELFHGKIVSDIAVEDGNLSFVQGATEQTSQTDADRRWQAVIKDIFPIDITHFELTNGSVRYQDKTKTPNVDVFINKLHVVATGLRNRPGEGDASGEFPAEITLEGETLGGGRVQGLINADPLAAQPHFHLSANVDGVNLPDLNESLKAIANVDVGKGTFRMAAEMAGKDGGFQGYVKPFFEDLDFRNLEDKNKGVATRLWEKVVSGLAWLVKNKARDQVGTRIPFEGRFGDPQVGVWATVVNLFRHGFVRAFNPVVEGTVRAENVRPDGKSADGKDVAEVKDDRPGKQQATAERTEEKRPGAPTGRPSK
jgi:hypothetical protein